MSMQAPSRIIAQRSIWQLFAGLCVVTALLITSVIGALSVNAQTNEPARESITLAPSSRTYDVAAGKTIDDKLTIVNDGTTAYDFIVYARPYSVKDNQYDEPDFNTRTKNADLYSWVQFPETRFHLEAGKSLDVNYAINVPQSSAPGGHYGVIFAEVQAANKEASGNTVIRNKRVGSLIYATVDGAVSLKGEAAGSSLPFWQFEPPLHAELSVKNSGNTHFSSATQLTVRDVFGNVKSQTAKDFQILPGTTRTMSLDWNQSPWFGLYKVEATQKFLDKTERSEGYVLMMPRLLPVLVLVIVLIGGVYAFVRRRQRQK